MHITVWNTVPYKCHNTTHYPFIYVLTCMLMLRAQIIYKMILTLMLFFSVNLSPGITDWCIYPVKQSKNNIHIYQVDF